MRGRETNDSFGALTQSLMWVITGDEIYRQNAIQALRTWADMNPDGYRYFPDAHIHTGHPLYQFLMAAEIIRATEPVGRRHPRRARRLRRGLERRRRRTPAHQLREPLGGGLPVLQRALDEPAQLRPVRTDRDRDLRRRRRGLRDGRRVVHRQLDVRRLRQRIDGASNAGHRGRRSDQSVRLRLRAGPRDGPRPGPRRDQHRQLRRLGAHGRDPGHQGRPGRRDRLDGRGRR